MTDHVLDSLAKRAGIHCGCVDQDDVDAIAGLLKIVGEGDARSTNRTGADRVALHWLGNAGLVEHGVSFSGGCWLSRYGELWLMEYEAANGPAD